MHRLRAHRLRHITSACIDYAGASPPHASTTSTSTTARRHRAHRLPHVDYGRVHRLRRVAIHRAHRLWEHHQRTHHDVGDHQHAHRQRTHRLQARHHRAHQRPSCTSTTRALQVRARHGCRLDCWRQSRLGHAGLVMHGECAQDGRCTSRGWRRSTCRCIAAALQHSEHCSCCGSAHRRRAHPRRVHHSRDPCPPSGHIQPKPVQRRFWQM